MSKSNPMQREAPTSRIAELEAINKDLLEALEAVMRQCEPTMEIEFEAMSEDEADAWVLARAAIKRAKGE